MKILTLGFWGFGVLGFWGTGLNAGVKTMIFDISGGSGAILGTPRGSWWGQN